jgi:hypothetical protein
MGSGVTLNMVRREWADRQCIVMHNPAKISEIQAEREVS